MILEITNKLIFPQLIQRNQGTLLFRPLTFMAFISFFGNFMLFSSYFVKCLKTDTTCPNGA